MPFFTNPIRKKWKGDRDQIETLAWSVYDKLSRAGYLNENDGMPTYGSVMEEIRAGIKEALVHLNLEVSDL